MTMHAFQLTSTSAGFNRFCYRRSPLNEVEGSCYLFHAACLTLLQENDRGKILARDVQTLFNIFEGIHYHRDAHVLRWVHNYYFEDILDPYSSEKDRKYSQEDTVAANKAKLAILADPLHLNVEKDEPWNHKHSRLLSFPSPRLLMSQNDTIHSLPSEILKSILCSLGFCDTQNLLQASATFYRLYGGVSRNQSSSF